jgi:hypothetical protein
MTFKMFFRFIGVCAVLFCSSNLFAQVNSNSSVAFPLMGLGIGSRSIGMGESYTAVADDFSAIHYNPAGLGTIWQPQLFLNHESYLASGFFETAGFVDPLKAGTLAFGLSYINYGSIDQRDSSGNLNGNYDPFDMDLRGGFGFLLGPDLYAGISSEWIRQQITSSVYTALVWNGGLLLKATPSLSFGLDVQNLGIDNINDALPTQIALGGAYRLSLAPKDSQVLLFSVGGNFSFESVSRLNAGVEFGLQNNYFLRAGYLYNLQDQGLGWQQGLSFGAGIKISSFRLDYSFTFQGDLGNTQTLALTAYFPPFSKPTPEPKMAAPITVYIKSMPEVVTILVTATPTPVPTMAAASTGVLQPGDKNPVMLRFQIGSQEDQTAAQLFDLAEGKSRLGLKGEALDLYLKAVQKDPNFDPAWQRLAKLYFEDSVNAYSHVLQLEPQNAALREWLSHINR